MLERKLLLLIARSDNMTKDLAAMTIGWMCGRAGVLFDTYYAADHEHGGLFARQGSTVIGGQHGARLARALGQFATTVVRLDGVLVFDSLFRSIAREIVDSDGDLPSLYQRVADLLGIDRPRKTLLFDTTSTVSPAAFYPEFAQRQAMAVPASAGEAGERLDLSGDDPALDCVRRHQAASSGIDLYEPVVASSMLAFNQRHGRLILPYATQAEAENRRDQMIALTADHPQDVSYGRWFRDAPLLPLAKLPTAYSVVEPQRHIVSVFADAPAPLPQPIQSWTDLEPDDAQLRQWAADRKILASWVLHSGEVSHDDSVLAFLDWSAMTKVKIGSGVHWQRYAFDPDVVELMHVPVDEGGMLGLVEPVLHSAGSGIIYESAGDPQRIADMMRAACNRIAGIAGARFVPRGVYCFADHYLQADATQPGPAQLALWEAIREAGFEYVISNALFGASRVLFMHDDFVVLNQAAEWHDFSPFVRGTPATFARHEQALAAEDRPGWLIGAVDTPIHGCPIYVGRPFGKPEALHPRISDFYDYIQNGGTTGRVVSATPRTVARYARLLAKESL